MYLAKKLMLFAVCCLFIIILSDCAAAIGIAPGRIIINFVPGFNKTYRFYVRGGTAGIPINISCRGDLCEYIKPSIDEQILLNPGEIRWFSVTVELPEEIEKPGKHECKLIAAEVVPGEPGTGVAAYSAVGAQIWIYVPYPGKYLEARLSAPNVGLSEPVPFTISLTSRGLENVTASGVIKVADVEGKNLATLYTNQKLIESRTSDSMEAVWDTAGMPPGKYYATATVEYGSEKPATAATEFKIGDILIKIINITYQDDIYPGDIVKFELDLDSYWNQKISDAYVTLEAMKDGKGAGSSKSETFDMDAWKSGRIPIFWDTGDLEADKYEAKFTVHYLERTTEKTIEVEIKPPPNPYLLLIIIAPILAAIAAIAVYLKKRKKKHG